MMQDMVQSANILYNNHHRNPPHHHNPQHHNAGYGPISQGVLAMPFVPIVDGEFLPTGHIMKIVMKMMMMMTMLTMMRKRVMMQ